MTSRRYPAPELSDADWLREQYAAKTTAEIAAGLGCNPVTVGRALARHGIPRRTGRRATIGVGDRFGRLVVIAEAGIGFRRRFLCECQCGATTTVEGQALRSGDTRSCGCLKREMAAEDIARRSRTHGHASRGGVSVEYQTWANMHARCRDDAREDWQYYGALGITVCARWKSFENFLEDMGERPDGMSIDRIDPWGNYEPSNCRWATDEEQAQNQRRHLSSPPDRCAADGEIRHVDDPSSRQSP